MTVFNKRKQFIMMVYYPILNLGYILFLHFIVKNDISVYKNEYKESLKIKKSIIIDF